MPLAEFATEYAQLSAGEQSLFAEAARRLLAEGLIWRGDEGDTRAYAFLLRRRELVAEYLQVAGWELRHDERAQVFQVAHRDGAHRRRLSRDTTVWLLIMRLIYAEKRERVELSLTRYPTVTVGEVAQRYAEFFPGQAVRKKTSLDEALRTLQSLKLVRAGGGGVLRASNNDQIIELLPTLEVVVPASAVGEVAARLGEYQRARPESPEAE
ncbi:DUF4194 domain-containing protein [Oscillochloris sp. ZM17-4]|uniref:DUF4194 domain-containing protein n=1 Tax=Oscillochloris sp. ZM17-4 TaxID=2866714 RepID=UPI001C72CFE3|nr:DUF4194 domain-containing protein [Oscillochloris sp. ZM17-4]MBX0328595.1 DUF4194 domain-containing protein [Oscillochloris sp. ZM17-4]